jgi:hydroxymethylpyrimidine pyrophosphatase-like HAD family hydrolase
VALVTGRRLPSAREVADLVAPDLPLVLHNGALVVEHGQVIRTRSLPTEVALLALHLGTGHDALIHRGRAGEGQMLVEPRLREGTLMGRYLGRAEGVIEVSDLAAAVDQDTIQVMFGGDLQSMLDLEPGLRAGLSDRARLERTLYPRQGVGILDVLEASVSKGDALGFLCERFGIAREHSLALGDNWNDREMLERAGLGLLMGNAEPGLLGCGLPLAPSNDEDGVAWAVEKYVLGAF